MKPLNKGNKKPRGAAVDKEKDRLRRYCLDDLRTTMTKMSMVAEHLATMGESTSAEMARRIRGDLGKLEARVTRADVMKK